eukprot:TRINITY_DN4964_c0_g1_i2.p1 TRINITY_DN4964_c0_g1~~TRINITY_DN4964_c0_g1_i2.p1  ORF type:complete len:183 (+),score=30.20 TRINITY_DN4964_c0_g1_i2:34-549(+)
MFLLFSLLLVSLVSAQPTRGTWDLEKCTFTTGGKLFNLISLARPSAWTWKESYTPEGSKTAETVTFELNICRKVVSAYSGCNSTTSGANMIAADGTCTSLGDIRTTAMDLTPYKDGVLLQYFHGDWFNHTVSQTAYVYLICNTKGTSAPNFEHVRGNTWHLRIDAEAACPL